MAEATQELSVVQQIRKMEADFKMALPAHVPTEKFVRVVLTAVNGNPELAAADRRSLLESATKAAQDGLIPDGREAAFVTFNTNVGTREKPQWVKKVQYMPMVWGIVKKVRQSGELESLTAHVIYEHDSFTYELGDNERIEHKPNLVGKRGAMIGAYAIIKTKDGGIYREVMTSEEVLAVKNFSKAKDHGPWSGPFEPEMWRKTVLRRLMKRVPMSTDLERTVERDDDLYNVRDVSPTPFQIPQPLKDPLAGTAEKLENKANASNAVSNNNQPDAKDAAPNDVPDRPKRPERKSAGDRGTDSGSEIPDKVAISKVDQAILKIDSYEKATWPEGSQVLNDLIRGMDTDDQIKVCKHWSARQKELNG